MKLSQYAKLEGINYKTAYRWFKNGIIKGRQLPTGTILVDVEPQFPQQQRSGIAIYARVSSAENKDNLESQTDRLKQYCIAKGYNIKRIIKEVGSGVNDQRKQLLSVLVDDSIEKIVVEHKDRLTRFGFEYLKVLLKKRGVEIEVVNEAENDKEDLMQDLISIITSFVARYYGRRRAKRKTEKIIKELLDDKKI